MTKEKITTVFPDYTGEITAVITSNLSPKVMQDRLQGYHEKDIAAALPLLTEQQRSRLYALLDSAQLPAVIEYADNISAYLGELPLKKRLDVLNSMDTQAAVEYIRTLDRSLRNTIMELMDTDVQAQIRLLSSYSQNEIGSRMTANFISVNSSCDVKTAMAELIRQAAENDNVSTIYVTDDTGVFYGAVDLKDLIISRARERITDITVTSYPYVYADEQTDICVEHIRSYAEDSVPVLDSANRLVGVITAADIADLIDEEMSEDYAKLAGLSAEEDMNEPLMHSVKKRLPWLVVLLVLGLLVSGVVGIFEKVIATITVVVYFQSLILDMAGNVGTQSLAITIRVLMDENLTPARKLHLIAKEGKVGLCNGLILGSLSFVFIGLYLHLLKGEGLVLAFGVSGCTAAALVVAMFLSSLSGTVIPIILKKLNFDPAVASGPLITTVNDLVAVVAYYGLARIMITGLLGL